MKYTKILTTILVMVLSLTLNAQDNTFNGTTDNNWDTASNWSTGKVPPSHIVQKITIAADCVVPASNSTDYTFAEGSTFQINSGITFTNNGTGTWTMDGTYNNAGTYIGDLNITGSIEPGATTSTWVCGDPIIYDGQNYTTVLISSQCWMAENLNIGTMINGNTDQTDNSIMEKFCYNDDATNCATYGGLYQWDEMMQYTNVESAQGVCPTGWHLPSSNEWYILVNALGGSGSNTGSKMAGNAALWTDGALESDPEFNTSGMVVLPGGYRDIDDSFYDQSDFANLWTSTGEDTNAWSQFLYYNDTEVNITNNSNKLFGYSVRCVKD